MGGLNVQIDMCQNHDLKHGTQAHMLTPGLHQGELWNCPLLGLLMYVLAQIGLLMYVLAQMAHGLDGS